MFGRSRLLLIAGWAITIAVTAFMLRDVTPDLQQAPWAVKANAGLGIPANVVLPIGVLGLLPLWPTRYRRLRPWALFS